ncbi:MAG: spore maturation protein [Clostridia bacterium]|nr:spore maturation protein [Clostridia bacterium]
MIAWIVLGTAVLGYWKRVDLFQAFSRGAEDGLKNAFQIVPCLASTFMALRIMESGGLTDALCRIAEPIARLLGLPGGTAPLLLLRPLSGSASLALLRDILARYGPDSRTGLVASAMMGSGETVLYTCAVYLSAAGIRKSRYVIPVSLAGWLAGCVVSGFFFR